MFVTERELSELNEAKQRCENLENLVSKELKEIIDSVAQSTEDEEKLQSCVHGVEDAISDYVKGELLTYINKLVNPQYKYEYQLKGESE